MVMAEQERTALHTGHVPGTPRAQQGERRTKVLHVTEALGGGIATALEGYVLATPDIEHVVAGYRRPGYDVGDDLANLTRYIPLPDGKLAQLRMVRRIVAVERPDVIHAHSSWAGFFLRLGMWRLRAPLVYTPHCYAFERTDVGRLNRAAFRVAERLLAGRTDLVVANGPREEALAASFPRTRATLSVLCTPHLVFDRLALPDPPPRGPDEPFRVCMVGRLTPQKDPEFFAQTVEAVRRLSPDTANHLEWVWIGGGEEEYHERLVDAGVRVTGWLSRPEVLAELVGCDLYVHTASWEGFPLSIQEAVAVGVPAVARKIPALDGWPVLQATNPTALAGLVVDLHAGGRESTHQLAVALQDSITNGFRPELLREAYLSLAGASGHAVPAARPAPVSTGVR